MTIKSFSHNVKILFTSVTYIKKVKFICWSFSLHQLAWLHIWSLSNGGNVNISLVGYLVSNYIYIRYKFHFQCYYLPFFKLHSHHCWSVFSLIIHFFKISSWFVNERQRQHTYMLYCQCMMGKQIHSD